MTGENKPGRASARKIATTVAKVIGYACGAALLPTLLAAVVIYKNLGESVTASQVIPLLIGATWLALVGCGVAFFMACVVCYVDGRDVVAVETTAPAPRGVDPVADAIADLETIAIVTTAILVPLTWILTMSVTYSPAGVSTGKIHAYLIGVLAFAVLGFLTAFALTIRLFGSTEVKRITPEERAAKERATQERAAVAVAKRLATRKGVSP